MAEGERRQRVISSTPRLTPDDVASREFGGSFRGYAESEVRAYLRRVAEEMTIASDRELELLAAVDELEQQLRAPQPLDEQRLLDVLGEETARLLRTARGASDDIRRKAEERSSKVMEEAQAEAHRLRTDAAEILAVRTQEAEGAAGEIIGEAEARAADISASVNRVTEERRQRAEQEAEAIVEDARQQGRAMLEEARSARERVLTDLGRRRNLLQAQVEELRQGRDRLLEAYRVVKRTFLDATEALAQVEARAASERAHAPAEPVGAIDALVLEQEIIVGAPQSDATSDTDAQSGGELRDVDSLFARIRAGQSDDTDVTDDETLESSDHGAAAEDDPGAGEAPVASEAAPEVPEAEVPEAEVPEAEIEEAEVVEAEVLEAVAIVPADDAETVPAPEELGGSSADAWRARHKETVAELLPPLVKRAKRTAQDDQNALLDAVRRHRGRPSAEQVLRDDDALVAEWTGVIGSTLEAAYAAGRDAVGAGTEAPPDDLVREAAEIVAFPLRDRLAAAIDDVDGSDTSGLVERIGARYREWKNQQLERALGDVVTTAWSRGVYDGADDGTVLHWIPTSHGRCADCDDNALEPTVKGENFPTGQARPPAHPGCRCLLAPSDALADLRVL